MSLVVADSLTTAERFFPQSLPVNGVGLVSRLQDGLESGRIHPFLDHAKRHARMRENIQRDIPSFAELRGKHKGQIACVVGSGPTLKSKLDELVELHRQGAVIIAVNTAHDYLWKCNRLSRLKPRVHYGVLCDSNEWVADYMLPREKTSYLLASQCHEKTFNRFNKSKTYLWHAIQRGDVDVLKERRTKGAYIDYGVVLGTTVGLRAIQLALTMGVSAIHLIGFDSSASKPDSPRDLHATGKDPKRIDGRYTKNEYFCPIRNKNLTWYTNDAMGLQAMEFEQIIYQIGNLIVEGKIPDCKLLVHGDDELLPFLAANHDMHATYEKNVSVIAHEIHQSPDNHTPAQVEAARKHLRMKKLIQEAA